ncbi:hypothetical protein [Chroococcidiopsis sp. TS-821]|uniref:hypothetical protein n=2 Tax=Chroococcidiopsis sp. TS-821 TaxID=1378066 RepID=UPI001AF01A80|nr:hypothetical protein [Chroococcidiopsis sp. TS-821]
MPNSTKKLKIMVKTWKVNWKGHEILTKNRWFRGEQLYIDGVRCDRRQGLGFTSELRGQIKDAEGSVHLVTAKFRQGSFGTRILCHIFVDDQWVGGDLI